MSVKSSEHGLSDACHSCARCATEKSLDQCSQQDSTPRSHIFIKKTHSAVDGVGVQGPGGVHLHVDREGSAYSCGGQLQSCRTSPRTRADWLVLCTARERGRECWLCCLAFSNSSGTINHLASELSKQKPTNTHFLQYHATRQNNEKTPWSCDTCSLSPFLCIDK